MVVIFFKLKVNQSVFSKFFHNDGIVALSEMVKIEAIDIYLLLVCVYVRVCVCV